MVPSERDDRGEAAGLAAGTHVASDDEPSTVGVEPQPAAAAEPATSTAPQARRSRRLPELDRGTVVGRYVVVDPLGRGGMGDVYGAYDPELDRRIALKLVRDITGDGRARLIAEAQAMARVSHPNVISVHDAGSFADGVFIAMELVDGETLAAWRKQARTRAAIMAVFTAAGHGLAAAHAAGIVHRDFKPGNVMLGRDGRVRVLDFGLARFGGRSAGSGSGSGSGSDPVTPAIVDIATDPDDPDEDDSLRVMASRVMGTPSYMAPEQRRPGMHDARVDQYAFAVALYETLYGERPFDGDDAETLAVNAAAHRVRPPPRNTDVPAWTRQVLVRALSPDPVDRFLTMPAMLGALAHDPAVRRRRLAIGLGGVAVVALGVGALVGLREPPPAPCRRADAPVARAWAPAARARIVAAFAATDRPYAPAWAGRVAAEFDRRTSALGAARIATCEATSVRHEQSPALLDLRMACLDRRLGELDALIDRLGAGPDPALMDHALDAAAALPPLDTCADAAALLSVAPRPSAPALTPHLAAAEAALAAAAAAIFAADVRSGRAHADAAVSAADLSGHGPLRAEARLALVRAARRSGDLVAAEQAVFEAATLAAEDRADRTAAEAWILSVGVLTELGRPREALALVHAATAGLGRIGRPRLLRAELLHRHSQALEAAGEVIAAAARQDEAIALRTSDGILADELGLAEALNHRGRLASHLGDHAAAEALYRRALAIRTARLGESHPDVATSLNNLGAVLYHQGQLDEALALYQDALTRRIAALGPDHIDVGATLNNLGGIYLDRGDLIQADQHFARALASWEKALGPDHLDLAIPLGNLGDVALLSDDPVRAFTLCRRAYDLEVRASGTNSPDLAYALTCQGEAQVARGQAVDATALLERALALRDGSPTDANELARTRLALASALHRRGVDPGRVQRLAAAARAVFAEAGPTWARRRDAAATLAGDRP